MSAKASIKKRAATGFHYFVPKLIVHIISFMSKVNGSPLGPVCSDLAKSGKGSPS